LGSSHQIKKAINAMVMGMPIMMSKMPDWTSMIIFKERVKLTRSFSSTRAYQTP